jgi:hypothetical protein
MAHRRNRPINLPAPYLKRVWLDPSRVSDPAAYRLMREFWADPAAFIATMLEE